jgi:hypothetical protein
LRQSLSRKPHRGDHSSRHRLTSALKQPTRGLLSPATSRLRGSEFASSKPLSEPGDSPLLFGLAPRGVFRALDVAIEAVGSYPTFSPLPGEMRISKMLCRFPCSAPPRCTPPAVYSLWHFPWLNCIAEQLCRYAMRKPPGVTRRVAQIGVRTFLPSTLRRFDEGQPSPHTPKGNQRSPGSPAAPKYIVFCQTHGRRI